MYKRQVQGWCTDFPTSEPGTGEGWLIQSAIYETGLLAQYRDGQLIETLTHNFETVDGALVIGAELDGTPAIDMEVAAAIVYDRSLTLAEQDQVLFYLQQKYFGIVPDTNVPPTANNDIGSVPSSGASTDIDVLDNDTDPDGSLDPASVDIVGGPSFGSVLVLSLIHI